jgi:hypothetical protein
MSDGPCNKCLILVDVLIFNSHSPETSLTIGALVCAEFKRKKGYQEESIFSATGKPIPFKTPFRTLSQ